MVFHMKTTLIIPDTLFRQLKRLAIERGQTLSNLVTELLKRGLAQDEEPVTLPELPTFNAGRPRVDVANRDELYRVMEED